MHQEDILSRLLIVIILGYDTFTHEMCHTLEQHEGLCTVCMHMTTVDRQRRENASSEADIFAFSIFMKNAEAALKDGKHTLIVTGYPKRSIDASYLHAQCPNLLVLSLEENIRTLLIKSQSTGYEGLGRDGLRLKLEDEESEIKAVKSTLSRSVGVEVISGARGIITSRRFLIKCIEECRKVMVPQPEALDMAVA